MLINHLLQQIAEVHLFFREFDLLGVVACDLKKFIDHLLQTVGLLQRDADIFCLFFVWEIRHLLQQIQIPNDRGQGGTDVMGEIHHQFIFPLFRSSGLPLPLQQDILRRIQLDFKWQHLRGEPDILSLLGQKAVDSLVNLLKIVRQPAEQVPEQERKNQQDCRREESLSETPEISVIQEKGVLVLQAHP